MRKADHYIQYANDKTFSNWGKPVVWHQALQKPGGAQMQWLRRCYESVGWWRLVPRPNAVATKALLPEARRIFAKVDDDKTSVIYFPQGNAADLRAWMAGVATGSSYSAEWFDPRTGKSKTIKRPLTPAEKKLHLPNRPDKRDWMLILRKQKP